MVYGQLLRNTYEAVDPRPMVISIASLSTTAASTQPRNDDRARGFQLKKLGWKRKAIYNAISASQAKIRTSFVLGCRK
jgi:hypothetical protein